MTKLLGLLPPWVPVAAIGLLLVALVSGCFVLRASWQAEGAAKFSAAVNAASLRTMSEQAERNQVIGDKLERLTGQRSETIKETIREVYIQPSSETCRQSAPMRALNGRLQYRPNGHSGSAAAAKASPPALSAAGR